MKKKLNESNKRISFPIGIFAEGINPVKLSDEMHVVPTGKWDHPAYGEMEITTADIQQFIKNFKAKVRRDLPITAGHDNGGNGGELPAIGWFRELFDRGVKGLYAVVEWTEEGKRLLQEKAFKYFSPEFYDVYADPETGKTYEHVLVGGALTNKPYFKELDPVVMFSESAIINQFSENKVMDIKTITAKKPEELSQEEKDFLVEHKDELSDDEKETFKSVVETSDNDDDEDGDGNGDGKDGDDDDADDDGKGDDDGQKNASEKGNSKKPKMIQMSEAQVKALETKANAGQKAFDELEKMRIEKSVSALVFSESNKEGRFAPKQKDAIVSFVKSLSEKQRDQFANIVNGMPKASIFKEEGDNGSTVEATVFAEVEAKVQDAIKASEGKLKYADALKKVFKENPDLSKRYEEATE